MELQGRAFPETDMDLGLSKVPNEADRVGRLRHPSAVQSAAFRGRVGESAIAIRLRRGAELEIHVSFAPRVSYRRASKFLSRLGLRGLEGTWT